MILIRSRDAQPRFETEDGQLPADGADGRVPGSASIVAGAVVAG